MGSSRTSAQLAFGIISRYADREHKREDKIARRRGSAGSLAREEGDESEKEDGGEKEGRHGVMVLACASSTVAGRTCRDHGGLVQPRKRRPHGSNGSRTSSVLFEIPSNFIAVLARSNSSSSSTLVAALSIRFQSRARPPRRFENFISLYFGEMYTTEIFLRFARRMDEVTYREYFN